MKKLLSLTMSLRGRMVMLVCLATLPAVLFTFYIANNERLAVLQRMEEDAHHIISLISREHFYQMAGAKSLLHWLADRIAEENLGDVDGIKDSALLPSLLAGYPQLANIAVLAPSGDVISSARPLPSGSVNMRDYDAIRRALQSHDIETGVYIIGPIVKKPILHLAYAIRNAQDIVHRIAFVAIDLEWLGRLTDQVELPAEHILLIVDRDGRVLASSAKSSAAAIQVGMQIPEFAEGQRQEKTMIKARVGGVTQSFAVAPMEGLPGVLVVSGLSYDQIYVKANNVFYRMMGILLLYTLCTMLFVIFFEEFVLIRYLRALSSTFMRFGQGDFSARAAVPFGQGELQEMARTFNSMAETLMVRHGELKEAHDRLNMLTRHLQVAREEEAQRISRDLHDEAGQVLTSLKMDLAGLQKKCRQCQAMGATGDTIKSDIDIMGGKIDHIVNFIRRISSDLRPPILDKMGLSDALERLAGDVEKNSDLAVETEISALRQPVDWLAATALYRIAQEALTNAVRHAKASLVQIHLRDTGTALVLIIKDDGTGIDPSQGKKETLGIIGMRERASLVGGSFSIEGELGKGTAITVEIPYETNKKEDAHENPAGG